MRDVKDCQGSPPAARRACRGRCWQRRRCPLAARASWRWAPAPPPAAPPAAAQVRVHCLIQWVCFEKHVTHLGRPSRRPQLLQQLREHYPTCIVDIHLQLKADASTCYSWLQLQCDFGSGDGQNECDKLALGHGRAPPAHSSTWPIATCDLMCRSLHAILQVWPTDVALLPTGCGSEPETLMQNWKALLLRSC